MVNKYYDKEHVFKALRELGSTFLKAFKSEPIPGNEKLMFELFGRIENKSLEFLKFKLNSTIPFAEGEFDFNSLENQPVSNVFWLFDSMDGAVQYMRHLPGWTFNLALVVHGEIVFSAIFDPVHDEMFWAEKGVGAFLSREQITVKRRDHSSVMMAATSHPPFPNRIQGLGNRLEASNRALLETYSFLRNFGPTALQIAYVASGRIDVYGQAGSDTFNWLPGILIAQEAGAVVLTLSGEPWTWKSESLLVGEASVVDQLLSRGLALQ